MSAMLLCWTGSASFGILDSARCINQSFLVGFDGFGLEVAWASGAVIPGEGCLEGAWLRDSPAYHDAISLASVVEEGFKEAAVSVNECELEAGTKRGGIRRFNDMLEGPGSDSHSASRSEDRTASF
ncbi:hypothetical protein ACGC1H_005540 [Rhizoctonia solani]